MKIYELVNDFNEDAMEEKQFICGTEYEIEDVKHLYTPTMEKLSPTTLPDGEAVWFDVIGYMRDGSLRNNGVELVTAPCNFNGAVDLFKLIHDKLCIVGPEAYTARTSTHVHVNVLPWTTDQLDAFVLLYALLEPVYFWYTPERKHNIHCVPLNYTLLPGHYSKGINYLLQDGCWSKYTAFNVLPVTKQGTVEFRHLGGTGDLDVYTRWLEMIESLWDYVNERPNLERGHIKFLLESYSTIEIAKLVFDGLYWIPFTEIDFSVSTIDVKLAFV